MPWVAYRNPRSTRAVRVIILVSTQSSTFIPPGMRSISLFTVLCVTLLSAGCTNPRDQANMIATLNDAANEMSGIKNDLSSLQAQVDSLQVVIAKQDTTILRLANVTGVPIAK
jgi:peptidoglycan hydrolase CwlO-like protein